IYHTRTLEQLDRSLVGKIQIVDVGKLWEHIPIVGWMIVENKHCGELRIVESSRECVDEIDKFTEVSMKLINIGSMQVFDQFNIRNKFAPFFRKSV
ncbi:hypothetical protein Tco_0220379, partial [Tanacetum coccineum]